ncbi:hypothetical protein N7535_007832 [Penicillium sp. DV-2018c]|nr:hypothetical protein N7461_003868 [Penicillium sp. DV-2018c]KAJ5566194.1 hypothetical protein N7535_007832 [Penicillium sp. DV-2018c]
MNTWRSHHGPIRIQLRRLSLQEHHSHKLLKDFNIPVPLGFLVATPEEARDVVSKIDAPSIMKAQILAGGRGKGKFSSDGKGGVRLVESPSEAFENATRMLGSYLTTKQTPPEGLLVSKLYIYKAVAIAHEYYIAMTFDRQRSSPVLLISDEGGINIESNVDKLHKLWFGHATGITPEIDAYIQAELGFSDSEMKGIQRILGQMVKLFHGKDATLLELNPLVRSEEGEFVCLDAKFEFDNAAEWRQKEIFELEERSPEEEEEHQASKLGLSYVRLEGNIGNIVNGAGLAMATNDLIRIVRCDMIAEAIIAAAAQMGGFKCPVVVRLQGTNSERGLKLIRDSGLENLIVEPDFEEAARMIVEKTSN